MTTRLSSLEGYPSSPLYAICTLLLEYRRDLRPEPREDVPRELGSRECAPETRITARGVFRHICAGLAIGAFAIDYEKDSPEQMRVVSAWWVLWVVRHGRSRSDPG